MDKDEFLNKVVSGYIQKDLENINSKIPPVLGEVGNVNFPIALCILAYMEYLGGFLIGKDMGFDNNVETYIKQCFKIPGNYNIKILRDLFRHGLAHEYFARGGISRDGITPPLYRNYQGKVILDAQTLLNDFLESLNTFKDKLTEVAFAQREKDATNAIKDWEEKYKDEIKNLPFMGDFPIHTRTSGATIYPEKTTTTLPYDPTEK